MIFSLLILGLVGAVVFFHYVQGLFSAFLSAVIAAVAAAAALGCHEYVVFELLGGKMSDVAHGGVLCALYGGIYLGLRLAFDAMVPGNVNFGVWPNKIGGAVMGLIAGLFTGGIVAVAAQALPFGPSIAGFSRWETSDVPANLSNVPDWAKFGRGEDIVEKLINRDQLKEARLDTAKASGLLLPADDFVIGYISSVSAGALAGDVRWTDIHPDYLNQLYAQRIGIQPGAKKTAFPLNGQQQVEVVGVVKLPAAGLAQIDGDQKQFRPPSAEGSFEAKLLPGEGQSLVLVRAIFRSDASDSDNKIRFSLSSFRLKAGGKNFYPVALLRGKDTAVHQRADDFLVTDPGKGVDLIFSVDNDALVGADTDITAADVKVDSGVFLEFKRLTRVGLDGKDLFGIADLPDDPRVEGAILRRRGWPEEPK